MMMRPFLSNGQGVFILSVLRVGSFFLSQLIVNGCFEDSSLLVFFFFGKGHSSASLVSFFPCIVSKGDLKAAEKEERLNTTHLCTL